MPWKSLFRRDMIKSDKAKRFDQRDEILGISLDAGNHHGHVQIFFEIVEKVEKAVAGSSAWDMNEEPFSNLYSIPTH